MSCTRAETRATKIPEQQKCNNIHSIQPQLHPNSRRGMMLESMSIAIRLLALLMRIWFVQSLTWDKPSAIFSWMLLAQIKGPKNQVGIKCWRVTTAPKSQTLVPVQHTYIKYVHTFDSMALVPSYASSAPMRDTSALTNRVPFGELQSSSYDMLIPFYISQRDTLHYQCSPSPIPQRGVRRTRPIRGLPLRALP